MTLVRASGGPVFDRFKAGDSRIDIGTFQGVSNVLLPSSARATQGFTA